MSEDPVLAALARLEEGQKRLDEGQKAIREDMIRLRTELMARLDRHQNELTGLRDDIGVNMAAVLHTGERNQNTRDEVRLTRE